MKACVLLAAGAALLATPALARDRYTGPVYSDSNSHYLDYKTDLSEARRELRKDLMRANDAGDRADAWREYRREVADARYDFSKEMRERGRTVRTGRVSIDD
jgi:hypothetical protein